MSWEGLGHDPVPGDPDVVRAAAAKLARIGEQAELLHGRLRVLDGGSGPQVWRGDAADRFRDMLSTIGPDLARMASGHHDAEQALRRYADALEGAQRQARQAETNAEHAISERNAAKSRGRQAATEASTHESTARAATLRLAEAKVMQLAAPPDPVYHAQMQQYQQQQGAQQASARARADQARTQETAANAAAGQAEGRLTAAKKLAAQAASLRDDAARTAVRTLDDAGAPGIRHRSFAERMWRGANDKLRDITASPEFESWMNIISDVGGIMSTIGGVMALIPFPPFQAVGGVLLATGAALKGVAFAGTLLAAYYGNANGGQVLGRGLDFGLSMLGAARLVRPAAGAAGKTTMAGNVKRAIWYDDARHAKGVLHGVHATPKFAGKTLDHLQKAHIDPKLAFRAKTGAEVGWKIERSGESLYKGGEQLHKDISRFHDPEQQHTLKDEAPGAVKTGVKELGKATGQNGVATGVAGAASEFIVKKGIEVTTK